MYLETLDKFADLAAKKVKYEKQSLSGFIVGTMMAAVPIARLPAVQRSTAEPGDLEELASALHTNGRKITGKLAEERDS